MGGHGVAAAVSPPRASRRVWAKTALAAAIAIAALLACARAAPPPSSDTPSDPASCPPSSDSGISPRPGPAPPNESEPLRFATAGWDTDFAIRAVPLSEIVSGGLGRDAIRPIDAPEIAPVSDAFRVLDAAETVIAVESGGERRAYPLSILIWHEIVNDTLGGTPIAVTYCPLCNSAVVFDRRADGRTLDFGTTGNLRHSDLVMWDRQTESWWQQITGEAIVGELSGARLKRLAAASVTWREFRRANPDAAALTGDSRIGMDYAAPIYGGYDAPDGYPPMFAGMPDRRLPPMERVLGVDVCGVRAAYPFSALAERPVVNDSLGGKRVVAIFDQAALSPFPYYGDEPVSRASGAATAFYAELDGRALTFSARDGAIADAETGSTWNALGEAVDGEMKGRRLAIAAHANHFWFAWAAFHPDTEIRGMDE